MANQDPVAPPATGLLRDSEGLQRAVTALTDTGYRTVWLDAAEWNDEQNLFAAFAQALFFPSYFGRNWDAFEEVINDLLTEVWPLADGVPGLVVAVDHGDHMLDATPRAPGFLVEIFTEAARRSAPDSGRLLLRIQVGDEHALALGVATQKGSA